MLTLCCIYFDFTKNQRHACSCNIYRHVAPPPGCWITVHSDLVYGIIYMLMAHREVMLVVWWIVVGRRDLAYSHGEIG